MSEPRPIAPPDALTAPWWEATSEERLLVQRCGSCGNAQHYPRSLCTKCWSADLAYVESPGEGEVYSYTVVHRSPHPAFAAPYTVALVRLDEGPVILTNIVGGEVGCGSRVRVVWEDLSDGRKLPLFTPVGG
ncbi:MAG TPA: Zn-ribbon domain-containing OB-fold protein [Actinomycetota bacterium]|nr:Zn-ribbon domain-containing OB-fold protein [Actinomycetota bacterium]